jgi:MFS family permease
MLKPHDRRYRAHVSTSSRFCACSRGAEVAIRFFQQFVGINALIYYSASLFETLGLAYNTRLIMGGVMNVCQLVGVTPSFLLLDVVGRRTLLLWGSVGMTICHVVVAALVGTYTGKWESNQDKGGHLYHTNQGSSTDVFDFQVGLVSLLSSSI